MIMILLDNMYLESLCRKSMHLHQRPLRLTVLAAALGAALSAQAQQAQPAIAASATIQKVEIKGTSDGYDARRDDTASKIVLNHDDIVKYGDTTVLDVLKRLPGVTVSGAAGRGGEVRMRGLGSGYTQILLNGERAPAGFSVDTLAPDAIERIEVMRAATAELSTQSIAGTINIVLKKAIKNAQRELKAGVGAGKDSRSPSYNLQLSDRKDQLSYSLAMSGYHYRFDRETPSVEDGSDEGGPFLRNSAADEDGRFDAYSIGPRLNWTFANGDTLTSQSFFNVGRFKRAYKAQESGGFGTQSDSPYVEWDIANENRFLRSDLNWVKKLDAGAKLDLKIGAVSGTLRNDAYRRGFAAQDGQRTLDNYVKSRGTDRGFTSTGKYAMPIGEGHALAVGWDGGLSTREDSRIQVGYRVAGQVTVPDNANEHYTGDVTRLAVYAQDEWNVTPRWSVYLGARWEGISTAVSGSNFIDTRARTSVWSPLFQTLYKLPDTKGDQLRFALTRTYKAPSTQSLIPRRFTAPGNKPTEPVVQGNPDLKPELALGLDASYEHYWSLGAMVSVSASMRRIDGYTRSETSLADDGQWVSKSINDGTARTRSLELEAKSPLKSVLADAPAIDLRANLSRNWSSVDAVKEANNRLDQQTPFSATLGIDHKGGRLTSGASYSFKNGGPVRISTAQSAYVSVRRELEMYGLWKFDPKNQLRLTFTNILAQDVVSESTFVQASGMERRRTTAPGEAVARATLEMKF
jgi:outer membrane receptor for ferrienterochelin and colicins